MFFSASSKMQQSLAEIQSNITSAWLLSIPFGIIVFFLLLINANAKIFTEKNIKKISKILFICWILSLAYSYGCKFHYLKIHAYEIHRTRQKIKEYIYNIKSAIWVLNNVNNYNCKILQNIIIDLQHTQQLIENNDNIRMFFAVLKEEVELLIELLEIVKYHPSILLIKTKLVDNLIALIQDNQVCLLKYQFVEEYKIAMAYLNYKDFLREHKKQYEEVKLFYSLMIPSNYGESYIFLENVLYQSNFISYQILDTYLRTTTGKYLSQKLFDNIINKYFYHYQRLSFYELLRGLRYYEEGFLVFISPYQLPVFQNLQIRYRDQYYLYVSGLLREKYNQNNLTADEVDLMKEIKYFDFFAGDFQYCFGGEKLISFNIQTYHDTSFRICNKPCL